MSPLPTNDEQPRTPLTLEYVPEPLEGDNFSQPVFVAEPSFAHPGRVFMAIHPGGKRVGLHVLPDDVRRFRDHLNKLLMDPPTATPEEFASQVASDPEQSSVDWQKRIRESAERVLGKRKRGKWLLFRLEFQIGDIQGVLGRLRD